MMEPYVIHFAPLQGYTDSVYREAHAQIFGGVETYYTPFVRLEKTGFRNKELRDLVPEANTSASLVPQMIAASPEEFRRIAGLFRESGYRRADITFLNGLPLTHLTLHPRIGTQQYKGKTDLSAFSRFYDSCTLPLFYNGDIRTLPDIRSLTGRFPRLKGIMIGRGLLSSPWLATEYISDTPLTAQEKIEKLSAFHALLLAGYSSRLEGGEHQVLDKMKTLWDYLLLDAEKRLRKKILKSSRLADYQEAVRNLIYDTSITAGQ